MGYELTTSDNPRTCQVLARFLLGTVTFSADVLSKFPNSEITHSPLLHPHQSLYFYRSLFFDSMYHFKLLFWLFLFFFFSRRLLISRRNCSVSFKHWERSSTQNDAQPIQRHSNILSNKSFSVSVDGARSIFLSSVTDAMVHSLACLGVLLRLPWLSVLRGADYIHIDSLFECALFFFASQLEGQLSSKTFYFRHVAFAFVKSMTTSSQSTLLFIAIYLL